MLIEIVRTAAVDTVGYTPKNHNKNFTNDSLVQSMSSERHKLILSLNNNKSSDRSEIRYRINRLKTISRSELNF